MLMCSPPRRRPARPLAPENDPWLARLDEYTKRRELKQMKWQQLQEQKQVEEALEARAQLNKNIHSDRRLTREAADRMVDRLTEKRQSARTQGLAKQLRAEEDASLLTLHKKQGPLTSEKTDDICTRLYMQGTVEPRSSRTAPAQFEKMNRRRPIGDDVDATRWHGSGITVDAKTFAERQQVRKNRFILHSACAHHLRVPCRRHLSLSKRSNESGR